MAFLDKVKNWVSKNPDKAGSAIEKAGDFFDQKTRGKYTQQVNKAQNAARGYVDKNNPGATGQPPVPPAQPPQPPQPPVPPHTP